MKRINHALVLGVLILSTSSMVWAQLGGVRDLRQRDTSPRPMVLDPLNPPAKAQLESITLDGDIDDLLGMVGNLGGLGCAFEVSDPSGFLLTIFSEASA